MLWTWLKRVSTWVSSWSSDALITTEAGRVLGTVRMWVRHPVRAGASATNPTAKACLILISTNFKYIRPDTNCPLGGILKRNSDHGFLYLFDVSRFGSASQS